MYNKEDLKFYNMEKVSIGYKKEVFKNETELSIEEKIKFMDQFEDGIASYMLNILTKWEEEQESLPKDSYGTTKTVSKKAWIKRNDPRKIIDNDYKIGKYYMFKNDFKEMSLICPHTEYGHNEVYTGENIIHQWYHDLCMKLYLQEKEYFKSIDSFEIKLKRVADLVNRYHIYFDSKKVNDIGWNNKRDVEEDELDAIIEAYEKIEKYIAEITIEVKGKIESNKFKGAEEI